MSNSHPASFVCGLPSSPPFTRRKGAHIRPDIWPINTYFPAQQIRYDYDVATGAIISEEGPAEERPVSPLELSFDLFFAALLSKLGHTLSEHLGTHPGHVLFYYVIVFQLTYQNWLQVRHRVRVCMAGAS